MKRYIIIGALLVSALTSFAQSTTLRIAIWPSAKNSFTESTLLQYYTNALRNTPGIVVVPKGDSYDCMIEINGATLRSTSGQLAGYAWAGHVTDSDGRSLSGIGLSCSGRQDAWGLVSENVAQFDRDFFQPIRNARRNDN